MILEYTDVFKACLAQGTLRGRYIDANVVYNVPKNSWAEWKFVHQLHCLDKDSCDVESYLAMLGLMGSRI